MRLLATRENVWEHKLRSEITMKRFAVKRVFVWWKLKIYFSWVLLSSLDFWQDLGICQNIIRQLLQWAILPKFFPTKILYRMVFGPLMSNWPLCGHHGCSWGVPSGRFCHLPPHSHLPVPPHPTLPPIPSTPSIINTDGKKGWKKYHEFQPSDIERVSYNESQ